MESSSNEIGKMKQMFDFSSFLENVCFITETGEEMTYNQLQDDANTVKDHLLGRQLVFCLCTNSIAAIVGYVAFLQKGIATVLLDAHKDKELLDNLLKVYHPNYVWAPTEERFGKALYDYRGYTLFHYSAENICINPDLALLLTTSGSTGSPKLVRLTQGNLLSNAESIAEYLHIDKHERPVTSLPMYYSFGMSVINSHLIKGATILLTDKAVIQKEFWDFVKKGRATSIAGVPYTYEMLRRLRFMRMDLPDMKTMIQAGGKLNAAIVKEYIEWAKKHDKEFIVMYGQTEAAPRMSYLPFDKALQKYSSIGIAIPGGIFSLRDADDREIVSPDVDGELVYKGDNVCLGYAETPEDLSKGDENHGVLHTGDVARRDDEGFFYITGRMKRFVKVWGVRVNLDAIEQLLKSVITDCACIGTDDKIVVFITETDMIDNVARFLSEKTKLNIHAFNVRAINKIPQKLSGKIDYSKLSLYE